jgi:voltage-gated potassium channel
MPKATFLGWHGDRSHEARLFIISLIPVALVGFAVAGSFNSFFLIIVLTTIGAAILIRWLFPDDSYFAMTFTSLIGVYTTIFAFFADEVFGLIRPGVSGIGFSLPISSFVAACWFWRDDIKLVVDQRNLYDGPPLTKALLWLLPVASVGGVVLSLSVYAETTMNTELAFLVAMLTIAVVVLFGGRSVAIFLVDAGLLFEEFFLRMSRLAIPAFAFLTFYSMIVIVFASFYSILSQLSAMSHFRVEGVARAISFSEAIHFSLVTISTVGYGDIVPASNLARALSSIEVICGVLLLLFGVSELLEYTREHRNDGQPNKNEPPP